MATTETRDSVEYRLRNVLWLMHGCGIIALYGDDGEMQCAMCGLDFRRDEPERLHAIILRTRRTQRELTMKALEVPEESR